jgi:hypothetical protein
VDETALLTDDEIVALCAVDGRPWPLGLTTVDSTAEDLTRAGMRGMRSLMVRRLAHSDADKPGMRPHQMIADDVAAFLSATSRVGVYVAPISDHSVMAGASVTAARTASGWVVDTATAAGVHALRPASAEEAGDAVLELVTRAHGGTLFTDEESLTWICVVRYGADARNTLIVGEGSVTGTVDGSPVTEWDLELLRGEFAKA